jgi:hypothetical protein
MLGVFKEESYSLGIFMQEENNMASLAGKNVTVRERFTYGSGKGSLIIRWDYSVYRSSAAIFVQTRS